MTVEPAWLAERLAGPAAGLNLAVPTAAIPALAAYLDRLLSWNRRINLTASRTAEEVVDRHVADSLAVVAVAPAVVAVGAQRLGAQRLTLVDVGSGAGFPGVVVALVRADIDVTLLEPARKKHAFLRTILREVPVPNARALCERIEQHAPPPARYDISISRATWPVGEWLDRGISLTSPGGLVIAMEGRQQGDLPADATRHPYRLGNRTRSLILRRV
jgi:16S rRNA (guanine527-N7)-methyltransferase